MPIKKSTSISISDIASRAGVSESTVSRALNNNPLISLKTRERIQKIAQEMNYSINQSARNLRLNKSNAISLIINAEHQNDQKFSDPFMMGMISSIADELSYSDYNLVFASPKISISSWHDKLITSKQSDGLIIIGQGTNDKELVKLHKMGVPIVVWGANRSNSSYCTVSSDNFLGGKQATSHLISKNRKEIYFFGDIKHIEIKQRYLGYISALEEADHASYCRQIQSSFSLESGYAHTLELIKNNVTFDGIFAASDNIAMGAIKALMEKGYSVPGDVSVVGFDDIPLAAYFYPPLTTVRQDVQLAGKLLVMKILSLINEKTTTSEILPTSLIIRSSS